MYGTADKCETGGTHLVGGADFRSERAKTLTPAAAASPLTTPENLDGSSAMAMCVQSQSKAASSDRTLLATACNPKRTWQMWPGCRKDVTEIYCIMSSTARQGEGAKVPSELAQCCAAESPWSAAFGRGQQSARWLPYFLARSLLGVVAASPAHFCFALACQTPV